MILDVDDLVAAVERASTHYDEPVWFQDDEGVLHVVASVKRDGERVVLVGETG